MKTLIKSIFAFILVTLLTVASLGNVYATVNNAYSFSYTDLQENIVKKILETYSTDQSKTEEVNELIHLLGKTDKKMADTYQNIMDYWKKATTQMSINKYNPQSNDKFTRIEGYEGSIPQISVTNDKNLCIVILGFALTDDGQMKNELYGRLLTGYALAQKYPQAKIAVTGGGTAKNNKNVTEAGLMADYLINDLGVDKSRVIIEDKAQNTSGNALNTLDILNKQYPNVNDLIMVTSDYHIARGCTYFNSVSELYHYDTGKKYNLIGHLGYYTGQPTEAVNIMYYYQMFLIADVKLNPIKSPAELMKAIENKVEVTKLKGKDVTLKKGDSLKVNAMATFNEKDELDVSEDIAISHFDKDKIGTQEVTLTYSFLDQKVTDTIKVTINEEKVPETPHENQKDETKKASSDKKNTIETVETGDEIYIIPSLSLMVISLCVLLFISLKTRKA